MPKDTQDSKAPHDVAEAKTPAEAAPPKLSDKGRRAIQGSPEMPKTPAATAAEEVKGPDKRDLSREEMRQLKGGDLSKAERGEVGERAMAKDNERLGRRMIAHHEDNPNAPGFDGVAWDPKDRKLCLQEAKNYKPGSTVGKDSLSAFEDRHWENNVDRARKAISASDLSKGDKIAAQAALRNRRFTTELYVPDGVKASDSARQLLADKGGDFAVKQFDGRVLRSQERKVAGRNIL